MKVYILEIAFQFTCNVYHYSEIVEVKVTSDGLGWFGKYKIRLLTPLDLSAPLDEIDY